MLKKLGLLALMAFAGLSFSVDESRAQTIVGAYTVSSCGGQSLAAGKPFPLTMDLTGDLCNSGSGGGGSATPFAPAGSYATLTPTNSSASVALPSGTSVVVNNTGTTAVSCKLTVGTGTAVANEDIIQPSSSVGFTVGSNTFENCIDQTGSASNLVVISGGAGLYAGAGGGSSGGGGETNYALETGGNLAQIVTNTSSSVPAGSNVIGGVTAADGALATEGTKADAAYGGSGSASIVAALKGVYTLVSSSIPAGSALIGKVGIDQTTPGTTNGVVINSASSLPLPTGAATSANQEVTAAGTTATSAQGVQGVTGGVALPVSAASLPLPTGAATAANQTVQPVGAAAFTPAQVSVASTATVIAAARTGASGTGRVSVTVTNTTTTAIYLGGSGVTTSTGALLPGIVGASATINTTAAIYGIVATGTATVTEFETY